MKKSVEVFQIRLNCEYETKQWMEFSVLNSSKSKRLFDWSETKWTLDINVEWRKDWENTYTPLNYIKTKQLPHINKETETINFDKNSSAKFLLCGKLKQKTSRQQRAGPDNAWSPGMRIFRFEIIIYFPCIFICCRLCGGVPQQEIFSVLCSLSIGRRKQLVFH